MFGSVGAHSAVSRPDTGGTLAAMDRRGRTVDQVAPEELTGDAAVVHLPDLAPGERIDAEMLVDAWSGRAGQAAAGSTSGPGTSDGLPRIVLLATGWDRFWGTDDYPRHPVLTEDAASALVEAGVQVLGADRLIIENLRGLTGLPRTVEFTALPLSIAGGDGAPVRAVARY
jgi:kynurenine formamidase